MLCTSRLESHLREVHIHTVVKVATELDTTRSIKSSILGIEVRNPTTIKETDHKSGTLRSIGIREQVPLSSRLTTKSVAILVSDSCVVEVRRYNRPIETSVLVIYSNETSFGVTASNTP
jgi:hypothetical protein